MTIGISTSINLRALEDLAAKWNDIAAALVRDEGVTKQVAEMAAQILTGDVRQVLMEMPANNRSALSRTGALARSFRPVARITQRTMHIASVSDLVYARIQDVGGFIRPKSVRFLAIPLVSMAHGKWPRHWKRGELFRRGMALSRKISKGRYENVYALSRRVRIEAKRYSKVATERAAPDVAKLVIRDLLMRGMQDGVE